ncbi:MAG: ABC-2 family transporter protein [Anaerolineae bacterium]|nr:ABC-2 family transporter protein [Anaerolineae bacterium]
MAELRYYAHIYIMIVSQYIKARMQYRADFIISSFGMLASSLSGAAVFYVIFNTITVLDGWTFHELLFMYGFYLLALTPMQIFFDHIWGLRFEVIDGSFIKYYFRPLNMMFYFMADRVDIKGFTQFILGGAILGYASHQLALQWTLPKLLMLLVSLFSASLVTISILVIASCSTFWILYSYPVLALAFRIREFGQYPVTIFDGFFRFLFTYILPIGFIAFYPTQSYLRPGQQQILTYLSPVIGIASFALAYRVWQIGVNRYTGTGS